MDVQLCLDALENRAFQAAGLGSTPVRQRSNEMQRTIAVFSRRAAEALTEQEYHQLVHFLICPQAPCIEIEELKTQIDNAIQQFFQKEVAVSGQDVERLDRPGGFLGADLCLVLHLQTRDMRWGEFSDTDSENTTMKLLYDKSVTPNGVFAMDWHWRGETMLEHRQRSHCPFKKFSKMLREMHDDFSWQILETVSMPFLITGSACARTGIRKRLSSARRLEVDGLDFDPNFRRDGLKRLILHLPHPNAGFYAGPDERLKIAKSLDQGWNFMLQLTGQNYIPSTFNDWYLQNKSTRYNGCSMVRESYKYRAKELTEQKRLRLDEYSPAYLTWSEGRLQCTAASIIEAGQSLAEAVLRPINEKQSETHTRRNAEMRKQLETEAANEFFTLESIQGRSVHIVPHGGVKIGRRSWQKPLEFRLYSQVAARILNLQGAPLVYFTADEVQIHINDVCCYSRPNKKLMQSPRWGEEWMHQIEHEVRLLGDSLPLVETIKETRLDGITASGRLLFCDQYELQAKYCYFRGIRFNVSDATDGHIHLHVELLDEGYVHPNCICDATPEGDPGRRLGMRVTYYTNDSTIEEWKKLRGNSNMAKINTLVDTEDGRTREWTSKQPRRHLKRFGGKAHWYSPIVQTKSED